MSLNISAIESLKATVKPWYDALNDPAKAQRKALQSLLEDYSKTGYGKGCGSTSSLTVEEYQRVFQPNSYVGFELIISRVSQGDYKALLPEPPVAWVMTRGTTGSSKILPVTNKHLGQIFSCGARAIANHVLRTRRFAILQGRIRGIRARTRYGM